jgi:hypothetical protein
MTYTLFRRTVFGNDTALREQFEAEGTEENCVNAP